MNKIQSHVSELVKLSRDFPDLIDITKNEMMVISVRMAELKAAGLTYATEYWRKDNEGNPKYFYLLYPQQQGEARKREYVGCDLKRVQAARAAIARAQEYDDLKRTLDAFNYRIQQVAEAMRSARRYLTSNHY